jgi:hypothetical protein
MTLKYMSRLKAEEGNWEENTGDGRARLLQSAVRNEITLIETPAIWRDVRARKVTNVSEDCKLQAGVTQCKGKTRGTDS